MINLIIDPSIQWMERGGKVARFLQERYPELVIVSSEIRSDVTRNVVLTQKPFLWESNALIFMRPSFSINGAFHTATNGVSVFNANRDKFRYCIPLLSEPFQDYGNAETCIGFYWQPYKVSRDMYMRFFDEYERPLNVLYMGPMLYQQETTSKHRWRRTESKNEFFRTITHFLYAKHPLFIDPWPTTLEEAIENNKQIVIIEHSRNFRDGIDDLQECIKYHAHDSDFLSVKHDNSSNLLRTFKHDLFYDSLFNVNWNVEMLYDSRQITSLGDFLRMYQ